MGLVDLRQILDVDVTSLTHIELRVVHAKQCRLRESGTYEVLGL
jgi:hypothetical protein